MTDIGHPERPGAISRLLEGFHNWHLGMVASPDFQRWAAKFWLTRGFVRQESAKLHDLVSGFVYSQTLLACTELGILHTLQDGPRTARALGARHGLPLQRMETLCQAAASVGLMVRRRDGTYRLGRLGAVVLGVPGLEDMIRHHRIFYQDLADPVALLKGETDPDLSRFWPYTQGGAAAEHRETAAEYSNLMATSQTLVAQETLDAVSLNGATRLLDVGGGTGMFLEHVQARYPDLALHLFDLPPVIEAARARLGAESPITMSEGSFLSDHLPSGADAISLIRVLYDHRDRTVQPLLDRVFAALPSGGRIIVSEPMSGGSQPCRAGDAYFGFYTLAMTSGKPRSAERHSALLAEAGFTAIQSHPTRRPFLTSTISARKP
jgi:demethylspheroidene O-methyltransferase